MLTDFECYFLYSHPESPFLLPVPLESKVGVAQKQGGFGLKFSKPTVLTAREVAAHRHQARRPKCLPHLSTSTTQPLRACGAGGILVPRTTGGGKGPGGLKVEFSSGPFSDDTPPAALDVVSWVSMCRPAKLTLHGTDVCTRTSRPPQMRPGPGGEGLTQARGIRCTALRG